MKIGKLDVKVSPVQMWLIGLIIAVVAAIIGLFNYHFNTISSVIDSKMNAIHLQLLSGNQPHASPPRQDPDGS